MSEILRVLQVFIASPNDLADERRAIKEVADELNAAFGKTTGLQIQLLGWEDRLPGFGRAQAQINEDVDRADLFVGFLWRRWGSEPGNPKYTSGFEEEFNRAVERRERTGNPEISLFFKEVTIRSPADLDDQLKRVLEFRETTASQKLLFTTFAGMDEWKKKTRDLLQGHLLNLLKNTLESQSKGQPQAPPIPGPADPDKKAAAQQGKSSKLAAKHQLTQAWAQGLEAIKQDEMAQLSKSTNLDKLTVARLGFAAGGLVNRDIEKDLPGVHLTNLLFKNRKQIHLTPVEWLIVLRSNLASESGYRPGWYWIRKTKLSAKNVLVHFACYDGYAPARQPALRYAKTLSLPLTLKRRGKSAPIEALCTHEEPEARRAALEYLAEKGTGGDLPLVEKLRTDPDADVRTKAEAARESILLRGNASQLFGDSVLTSPWVSEDRIQEIQTHAAQLDSELLRKALAHPDPKIQVFAAKELAARGSISPQEITALSDPDGVAECFRVYLLREVRGGKKFTPHEIRKLLTPSSRTLASLVSPTPLHPEGVLEELFKSYTYQELLTLAETETDDALIAYRILANKHFHQFGDRIRNDLKTNFDARRPKSKAGETSPPSSPLTFSLANLFGPKQPEIADFIETALSGLGINGDPADRDLILPFLKHKEERLRTAAILSLRRVGRPQDQDTLLRIAEEAGEAIAIEAAKTALILAPGEAGSAVRLLKSPKPHLMKLALRSLLNANPKNVWAQVAHRLYDEDDEIRKLVSAYAIKTFPPKHLAKLLDDYLAKDRYFYNVVHFLDRAIYAKPPLRQVFAKEIEGFLA